MRAWCNEIFNQHVRNVQTASLFFDVVVSFLYAFKCIATCHEHCVVILSSIVRDKTLAQQDAFERQPLKFTRVRTRLWLKRNQ